ncbi:MAG: amino acid permease [Chromatiaceae bacterium]|jgi:APA family basic amino acid/polyamine antiporter|nr:amino acid permease [Chromatiaceae bacterium]
MSAHRPESAPRRFIGYRTAVLIVIANMVGTGVFTTLGLQAKTIPDGAALLVLWGLGGLVALCGALCYAELAAAVPRSGGEYHLLSRTWHPALGRLAGLVSVTVGFAAPVALTAMALGQYTATVVPWDPTLIAVASLLLVTALHAVDVGLGGAFQVAATLVKIAVIAIFCVAGLAAAAHPGSAPLAPGPETLELMVSAPFGLALIFVAYAYSGWNAAAYVVDEVRDPQRTVPRALVHGTLAVTALYLVLNLTFLRTTDLRELSGTVEVGALSARYLFGEGGGMLMSLALSLLLVSSISAMVLAGPRVIDVIGQDVPALRFLAARNRRGAPTRAVLLQQGLALGFILTGSFEQVLTFAGFTLTLFALLTVAGQVRLRRREPDLPRPFRVPLYPLPPAIFILVSGAALFLVAREQRTAVLIGVALLLAGGWLMRGDRAS